MARWLLYQQAGMTLYIDHRESSLKFETRCCLFMDHCMKEKFTILIADRNRNVRDFLMREMTKEGYRVQVAKNGREVLKWVSHHDFVDLLIVDPDLPDAGEIEIVEELNDQIPSLPVVVHSFLSDYNNHLDTLNAAAYVEKEGDSIDRLKEVVSELLGNLNQPAAKQSKKAIYTR